MLVVVESEIAKVHLALAFYTFAIRPKAQSVRRCEAVLLTRELMHS